VAAVRQSLIEAGYVEGRNVAFEYRGAEEHYERLPALAAELVRREVTVIVSIGGITSAMAAKSATTTIPCRQSQPTRRQHHRCDFLGWYVDRETV
jgi:putative ABC transport system substrate-binding protein